MVLVAAVLGTLAEPQQIAQLNVPAGPMAQALNRLAAQADVDVVLAADLGRRRSAAVSGALAPEVALQRMVAGQGARVVRVGAREYRIVAEPRLQPIAFAPPAAVELSEVIVTAPAVRGAMDEVSGKVPTAVDLINPTGAPLGGEALADASAAVDSTRQGAGRNKLFVRGVADSGFSGVLQSTVGQYFGDLRLGYGSPDPDIALVDIRQIDVFEGPQGSRFGSGSIGGVLRLSPEPPDPARASGRLVAGGALTDGGAVGGDLALVGNRPLGYASAVRLVAYARSDGGFIDNPVRDATDIDRVNVLGGRLALRTRLDAWTIDALALHQQTAGQDAQSVSDAGVLEKATPGAEPYRNAVTLIGVSGSRRLGQARLTSTFGLSRQIVRERFDIVDYMTLSPARLDRRQEALTLSSETLLEAPLRPRLAWNGGVSIAWTEAEAERAQNNAEGAAEWPFVKRRRSEGEAALFGETVFTPRGDLRFSAGGRLSAVRASSSLLAPLWAIRDDGGRKVEFVATPSFGASWRRGAVTVFARYEEAERPGGVTETAKGVVVYQSDRVKLAEAGARWRGPSGSLKLSAGRLNWRDIQADVLTPGGELTVRNAGDGVIRFVDLKAAWTLGDDVSVSGGVFVNDSRLSVDNFLVVGVAEGRLPNVARAGGNLAAVYEPGAIVRWPLRLTGNLRYVGQSRLGLQAPMDIDQGGYVRTEVTVRLGDDARAAALSVSNPFNVSATRFGLSSPYSLLDPQVAPLRPLTVRLGFDATF